MSAVFNLKPPAFVLPFRDDGDLSQNRRERIRDVANPWKLLRCRIACSEVLWASCSYRILQRVTGEGDGLFQAGAK